MDMQEIRRRWGAHIRALPLQAPFDLGRFLAELSARLRRPIRVEPSYSLPVGTTGRWIRTASEDIVQYDARATGRYRLQIIMHEIGHIECGHQPSPAEIEASLLSLLPKLTPAALRHVNHRGWDPQHPDEIEAEGFAALVLEEIDRRADGARPAELDPTLQSYTEFFGW